MAHSDRDGRRGGGYKNRNCRNCDWCMTGFYKRLDKIVRRRAGKRECRQWMI